MVIGLIVAEKAGNPWRAVINMVYASLNMLAFQPLARLFD